MFIKALSSWCRIWKSGSSVSSYQQLAIKNTVCFNSSDTTSNGAKKNEDAKPSNVKKKSGRTVDVIGEEVFSAIKDVANELHKNDDEMKKKTRTALIERLAEAEKETFDAATASQNNEMLSDNVVTEMLADVNALKPKRASHAAEVRHARRGLVLLRREIFYQAQQNGYTAEQAREISENAVKIAEARAIAKSKKELAQQKEKIEKEEAEIATRDEKEKALYNYAFQMAEQMLSPSSESKNGAFLMSPEAVEPLFFSANVFTLKNGNLGIFKQTALPTMEDHSLKVWSDLDANAARIWNQLFGPRNGFEEYIEWTKKGKMWPYPINNEYLLGEEEDVLFYEHIFLNKELEKYKLPDTGPIAHFMELVSVGLSKNPYMTVQKKRDHLKWFASFFDKKRIEEISRLHKAEQDALN